MSEYWKSTPKYWCKHCTAYIRDTPFERKQHESTAKHQNNLKRFLRDIQNDHERGERDKQKAKAEVERLNRITGTAATPDPSKAVPPTFHKDRSGPRTADDQKRQWQQLADMGIKVPERVQADMAMVGDWKAVPQQSLEQPTEEPLSVGVRKRKVEDAEEEESTQTFESLPKKRVWGKSTKALQEVDDDNLNDLLSTSISFKQEKQGNGKVEPMHDSVDTTSAADAPEVSTKNRPATDMSENDLPAPSEGVEPTARSLSNTSTTALVKGEAMDEDDKGSAINNIPEADPAPVFRKRKAKGNAAR